jgi:hypothetical protein
VREPDPEVPDRGRGVREVRRERKLRQGVGRLRHPAVPQQVSDENEDLVDVQLAEIQQFDQARYVQVRLGRVAAPGQLEQHRLGLPALAFVLQREFQAAPGEAGLAGRARLAGDLVQSGYRPRGLG